MIETIVRDFLQERLDAWVGLSWPIDKDEEKFVLIEKVGSDNKDHLQSARLAIQSYGPSLYDAALLNKLVRAGMKLLEYNKEIGSIKLISDYNFTDIEMKKYRYQAVFDVYYYE